MENLDIGLIIISCFSVILFLIFNVFTFFYSKLIFGFFDLTNKEYYLMKSNLTLIGYSLRLIYYFPTYLILVIFSQIKKIFIKDLKEKSEVSNKLI